MFLHCGQGATDGATDKITCVETSEESVSFTSVLENLGIRDADRDLLLSALNTSVEEIADGSICNLLDGGTLDIDEILEQAQELDLGFSILDLVSEDLLSASQIITLNPLVKNVVFEDLQIGQIFEREAFYNLLRNAAMTNGVSADTQISELFATVDIPFTSEIEALVFLHFRIFLDFSQKILIFVNCLLLLILLIQII